MKPRRPDSAKSHVTKQTQDSQPSKKDLNASKFSQTFSSGVNSIHEKGDEFKNYVTQKDKDPRFKHLKSKLQVIQQKSYQPETSKTSFKPFQKKKDKTSDKNSNKKIEQKPQKVEKEEEQLSLSRGFAEKNKLKMNSLKLTISQQKQQEQKVKEAIKSKIKFDAFKLNKPGEKKQSNKVANSEPKKQENENSLIQKQEQKKEQKAAEKQKNQKTQKQIEQQLQREQRKKEYRNIEQYVNDIEARNISMFPRNYDQVINNTSATIEDLEKIDLRDFMNEPTEGDYEVLRGKINKMDEQILADESIDLDSLIGQKQQDEDMQREQNEQDKYIYASMSASDVKKRNAFLTQVLAGKISKKDIEQIEQMDRTSMRMYKIEHEKEEQDIDFTQINMVKRQTNRLMERNRLEAVGQLYRDCDYLSEEHKKRLEELLNGDVGESPFEFDELEGMRRRRIDESIRMYRQMSGAEEQNGDIFDEQSLPKDPLIRKKAQQKLIKQKVTNVNQRLAEVGNIVVTKANIESLMKKFQHTRTSSNYQLLCEQNQQRFEEQMNNLVEAESMLELLSNSEDIDEIIEEIDAKYRELESQIKRFNELDQKELKRLEMQRLKQKMREVQKVEKLAQQFDSQIVEIEKIRTDMQENLKALNEIQLIDTPDLACEGYKPQETLQDLDALITKKWQSDQSSNQYQQSE